MEYVLTFLIIYIIVLVFLLVFGYLIPKKRKRLERNKGLQFIIRKYKLSSSEETVQKVGLLLVFVNALIITIPMFLVFFVDLGLIWVMLISLAFFIIALLGIYSLIGIILKKKGW